MRVRAWVWLVVVAAGCADEPPVIVDFGDAAEPESDAGVPLLPRLPDLPYGSATFPGGLGPPPSAGWTSPPACSPPTSGAYCADCWSWTDAGPRSLDRNEEGDYFGSSLAVGDFNGDGYPDLAVGAPLEASASSADGSVYVYVGSAEGFQPWIALRVTDFGSVIDAVMGGALAAGDFNGDGIADLAIAFWSVLFGDTSRVGVAYGSAAGFVDLRWYELSEFDPDESTAEINIGDALAAGDFDDDGDDDLAVGVPAYPTDGLSDAGAVFVLEGSLGGLKPPVARIDLNTASIAPLAGDRFGGSLSFFDDPSGADTLVVGMPGWGWVLTFVSSAHSGGPWSHGTISNFGTRVVAGDLDDDGDPEIIVSGSSGGTLGLINTGANTTANITSFNNGSNEFHPLAVADLDRDGKMDLITYSQEIGGDGALLLYQGDGTNAPDKWAVLDQADRESPDRLGSSGLAADVDGDGITDLIAGAPTEGSGNGRVHLFLVSDVADWNDPPSAIDMIDQERALDCDICAVHGWSDGTICDLGGTGSEICVFNACVPRECGDGYRQDGVLWFPREGCDDGNTADGDACSSSCAATRLVVSSREGAEDSPARTARAIAEDGAGQLLFVYTADLGDTRELRARRFNYGGAPDTKGSLPIVLASDLGIGWDAQPSVAGLVDGGWVVVWTDPNVDGEGSGIAMRRVDAEGVAGPLLIANTETRGAQREARVAAIGSGWVVIWTDESGFDGPLGQSVVKTSTYDLDGALVVDELVLSDPDTTASQPTLAANGTDDVLYSWSEVASGEAELSNVMGMLTGGGSAFVIDGPYASQPAIAAMPDDSFLVAWVDRDPAADWRGDIQARPVAVSSDPLGSSTIVTVASTDSHPELAPSLAPLTGSEYLVAYEDGGVRRGLAYARVGMSTLATESTALAGYLAEGLQGDVTLLRTSRGIWFAWSDASDFSSVGDPDAYRSFFAYLLPLN